MVAELHDRASVAFARGKSEAYNKARPDYPAEVYSFMKQHAPDRDALNVVELGAGTGLFTRGLLAHKDWPSVISSVKAIEPVSGMRDVFSSEIKDPRVTVSEGTFVNTGIQDQWADVIMIATAFHWCFDFDAALNEFRRILRPDGIVLVAFNLPAGYQVPWVIRLWDYVARYDETRMHQCERWREVYDSPLYDQYFEPSKQRVFSHDMVCTKATVVNHVKSWSAVAGLSDKEKSQVETDVLDIIDEGEGLEWASKEEGLLKFPHDVEAIVMKRKTS